MKPPVYLMPLLAVAACLSTACTVEEVDDSDFRRSETEVIIENLELAGYPASEIAVLADGTVFVGGDAVVTLQASREMAGIVDDLDHEDGLRAYRTNNMIDTTRVQTICVDSRARHPDYPNTPGYDENSLMSTALNNSLTNYNSQNLQFTMVRVSNLNGYQNNLNGCDATINAWLDGSGGGIAGFPANGDPYGQFAVGANLASQYGVNVATHVTTHELGHCVGFRHTDYFNRSISCGTGGNEGDGGVGAVHIPGTSTGAVMNGSVMNACFNAQSSGSWTADDVTALDCLYDSGACAPPPPPSYGAIDQQGPLSGGQNEETFFGPYDASGLEALRVSISGGTGDVDLYVRFGAQPTTGAYDCRPYLSGNNEICEFNPSQSGNYYVMLRGYQAYSGTTLLVEGDGQAPPPPPPPPEPDPEVCDDGVDNDGDGATDCDDNDCSGDPVCEPDPPPPPPPTGWEERWNDNFNSGWGNWNDGGSDVRRSGNDSAYGADGSTPVRLRDNSGSASAMTSDELDLSNDSQLKLEFTFYPRAMENGEDFFIEYYDGSSWINLVNYAAGSDFNNNTRYNVSLELTDQQVNFASNSRLRIRCDASANSDYIYVDNVVVSTQ